MAGYIILTTSEWLDSVKTMKLDEAVFWRKRKNFKAINIGENIYFLKRGHYTSNQDRYIVGSGVFIGRDYMSSETAWEAFNSKLGYLSEKDFLEAVLRTYKERDLFLECISINHLKFYSSAVSLNDAKVEISPYTVSGKKISQEESTRIDICGGGV